MGMCGPTWTVLFMTRLSIRPGTPYLSPSAHMEAKDYTEEDHTKWAAFACQPPLTVLSPGWDLSRLMAAFSGAGNQTKMAKSAIRDCSAFCQCMHARVVSLTVSVFKNKASSARHSFLQILPPQIEARATPCATASTPRSQIQSPPLVLLHYRPTAWAVGSNVWPLILDQIGCRLLDACCSICFFFSSGDYHGTFRPQQCHHCRVPSAAERRLRFRIGDRLTACLQFTAAHSRRSAGQGGQAKRTSTRQRVFFPHGPV